ncbi:MAG: hypothetical protein WDM90_11495 [Ferruginibacter sp.]
MQPKTTQDYVLNELEDWANFGVEGHFHARKPWMPYHEIFSKTIIKNYWRIARRNCGDEPTDGEPAFIDGKFLQANQTTV